MSEVAVAYIPVLHEGYRRFIEAHAKGLPLYLIGPELYSDYRPLAKDIRCLDAQLMARSIGAWGICSQVHVLDERGAQRLAAEGPTLTLPAEDISYRLVERWFSRSPVRYDTVFLRWDKSRSAQLRQPSPARRIDGEVALAEFADPARLPGQLGLAELAPAAERQAASSADWWRQVGAAIRFADGTIASA
ncbi:MAG TPA: hypothetical protein VK672_06745, partial [Solirubrobacteraceae bacterium]|nr:hypothetical protein [Solirubrobacteraceae bacterium]